MKRKKKLEQVFDGLEHTTATYCATTAWRNCKGLKTVQHLGDGHNKANRSVTGHQQNNQTLQPHGAGPLTVGCYCFGVGEVINYVKK